MHRDATLLGELDRVAGQIDQDLAQIVGVATNRRRNLGHDRDHELHVLRRGLSGDNAASAVDERMQVEVGPVERQLACLDLGKIEDILDEAEHQFPRPAQRLQHVGLLAIQRRVPQQVRHADDRVQRRAHLVTDDRDEAAFCLVRRLGTHKRIVHPFDEAQNVYGQRHEADHEAYAAREVRAPEIVAREDDGETSDAQSYAEEQVPRAVSESVGERDPYVNQEKRQAVGAGHGHEIGYGSDIPHRRDHPARVRNLRPQQDANENRCGKGEITQHRQRVAVTKIESTTRNRQGLRQEVAEEHHPHHQTDDCLLVLAVGPPGEAGAQTSERLHQPGHRAFGSAAGVSLHSC